MADDKMIIKNKIEYAKQLGCVPNLEVQSVTYSTVLIRRTSQICQMSINILGLCNLKKIRAVTTKQI
jgi:hypothetical protein